MRLIFLIALAGALQGCASIISGTTQNITINSEPDGADCTVSRENVVLTKITTPETIEIDKSKHDLTVKCELEDHYPETVSVDSEIQGSTWGNIILGGGIGWAVDSARGADNKYDDTIIVRLTPVNEGPSVTDRAATDADEAGSVTGDIETEPEASEEDRSTAGENAPECCE